MKNYQKLFQEMGEVHKDLFAEFGKIHDLFVADMDTNKTEFNRIGQKVLDVIRTYEKQLVGSTERSNYSKFSTGLSDKFWNLIRKVYPKIDWVGMK